MPSRRIEQQLENLNSLRTVEASDGRADALRKALADRVNVVVAKAAAIAAELQLESLIPELRISFERHFENPLHSDPQCWAKNALAKALKDLGHAESATFLRGIRHIQMEPVWKREEDTATVLRGTCALALVQCVDLPRAEVMRHLIYALTESAARVRADAALALEQMEGEEVALLFRLKARAGDEEPSVTGQVLGSLLKLEGPKAVSFVTEFLAFGNDEVREEAALALGGSRLSGAVAALKCAWETTRGLRPAEPLLRGISASRQEAAFEFLLGIVRHGRTQEAIVALGALELHRGSGEIRRQVAATVKERGERALKNLFRERFPTDPQE